MAFNDVWSGFAQIEDESYGIPRKTGWVLSPKLIPCLSVACKKTAVQNLCAEFRFIVETEDGLTLSKAVTPNIYAFTENQLQDTDAMAIAGIGGKLRESALRLFTAAAEGKVVALPVREPVREDRPLQMAAQTFER